MTETFASADEMSVRTNGQITADSHPFLAKELAAATRAIRGACGWHIAEQEELTLHQYRPTPENIWLPAMEIESIDAVTVDGAIISASSIGFDPETGWTSLRARSATIKYTAGFKEIPEDLVTLTLELAAGGLASPIGISREQAGGVTVTLGRFSGALTAADHLRLKPYIIGGIP